MRRLVWLSLGFVAACACGAYLLPASYMLAIGIVFAVAALVLLFWKEDALRIPISIALGVALGAGWFFSFEMLYIRQTRPYDGEILQTVVEVTDYSRETDYGFSTEGQIRLNGKPYKICLYTEAGNSFKPGDRILGELHLRLTLGNGEDKRPSYHRGNGIFLVGYLGADAVLELQEEVPGEYWAKELRNNILNLLENIFPEDTQAFARALLLGDTTKLSYRLDTAFQVSGIRHVVAVSGLHVSILFSLVYMMAGKRRFLTAILGIPALIAFAAVAGFSPSVVRACIMQSLVILALLLKKEYDPPTALAVAVLILLTSNPLTVTSVSFQLSVGCMIGIFLFCKKIHDYILRGNLGKLAKKKGITGMVIRWFTASVSVTLSSMSLTAPLCAAYFGMVSLIGVLTNMLTLWVISLVFYGIMLACTVGAIWTAGGCILAAVISWPMRFIQETALLLAEFPLSAVYLESDYIAVWLVFCYVLFGLFLLRKKKQPLLLTACILMGLVPALALSWLEPRQYCATVIDVGQGQSVLLRSKDKTYLVDCGGDSADVSADKTASLLLSRGIFHLDGVIVTHYDADHVNGVENLLVRIPADRLYLPDAPDEKSFRESLEQLPDISVQWVREITALETEGGMCTIFPGEKGKAGNQSSLSILFQRENCDILITGDRTHKGERDLMQQVELPELELLVAGHHGSNDSTSLSLIAATRPASVAISVGENNRFGHPNPETLDILQLYGCEIYRTDTQGTIDFKG